MATEQLVATESKCEELRKAADEAEMVITMCTQCSLLFIVTGSDCDVINADVWMLTF